MKIAMIGQKGIPATVGGVERHVEELSAHLASAGHEVTVFCRPHYTSPDVVRRMAGWYRGVRVRPVPSIATKHLDAMSHVLSCTAASLVHKFDIIHYHGMGPCLVAPLPAFFRQRIVATIHALDWRRRKWGPVARWALRIGEHAAVRFPDATIVVSHWLQEYVRKTHNKQTIYIRNGVQALASRPLERLKSLGLLKNEYVLYLGRFVPEKGCQYLIDAFRGLDTDKRLLLAGDAAFSRDYLDSLERRAEGDPRIIFAGPLFGEDKAEAFTNAYVFVLPSEVEGMPITLLEAMSCGCPCLASDIPENVEVIGTGRSARGFTFRSQDVADLHGMLEKLFASPAMTRRPCERAAGYVREHFGWEGIAQETEEVYQRLVNQRRRGEESL